MKWFGKMMGMFRLDIISEEEYQAILQAERQQTVVIILVILALAAVTVSLILMIRAHRKNKAREEKSRQASLGEDQKKG